MQSIVAAAGKSGSVWSTLGIKIYKTAALMRSTACCLTFIIERILPVTASTEREYLETKIAEVSENIRTLIEQAASVSGASDDDLVQERLEEQQALYDRLTKQRDALDKAP